MCKGLTPNKRIVFVCCQPVLCGVQGHKTVLCGLLQIVEIQSRNPYLLLSCQDIYLMRYDGPVSELNFSPSEVEDVKLIPMDQLKDVYAAQVRLLLRDKPVATGALLFSCVMFEI